MMREAGALFVSLRLRSATVPLPTISQRQVVNQVFEVAACPFLTRVHGVSEPFGAFGVLRKLFKYAFLGAVRNGKSLCWHRV